MESVTSSCLLRPYTRSKHSNGFPIQSEGKTFAIISAHSTPAASANAYENLPNPIVQNLCSKENTWNFRHQGTDYSLSDATVISLTCVFDSHTVVLERQLWLIERCLTYACHGKIYRSRVSQENLWSCEQTHGGSAPQDGSSGDKVSNRDSHTHIYRAYQHIIK